MYETILQAGAALRAGKVSCLELVEQSSARIRDGSAALNAFLTVTEDQAQAEARALDNELANGQDRGPLHGIPIAHKDLFYTAGVRTTNGSKLFQDFVPDRDADVVRQLRNAGAISMGKLNMHELAYGISSNNPHFGPVRNPHGTDHIPGGSSGGSAVAVATGMVFAATGSDTGGSIRIPASYCGIFGLKPTFDAVSRAGAFPLGITLDHMGPLTRTADDARLMLDVMLQRPVKEDRQTGTIRIGVAKNFFGERVLPQVALGFAKAVAEAQASGAQVEEVEAPDPAGLTVVARTVLLCEAVASLLPHLHRRSDIGPDVMVVLDQGRLLPATAYIQAQRIRLAMQRNWAKMMGGIDLLMIPTAPITAPKIGAGTVTIDGAEEDARLATTRFVRGFNALGLPAASLPCGKDQAGLPIGVQLVAKPYDEHLLLRFAQVLQTRLS